PLMIYRSDGPFISGALSPDGKWAAIASGFADRTRAEDIKVWRVDGTGNAIALHGHESAVQDINFSRDGSRIGTSGYDPTGRIWRAAGSGLPVVLRHPADVEAASFPPDGTHVLTVAPEEHVARLWRADGQGEPVLFRHDAYLDTGSVSSDGRLVLTGGN